MRTSRLAVAIAVAGLVVASCADDAAVTSTSGTDDTTAVTTAPATTTTPATTDPPPSPSPTTTADPTVSHGDDGVPPGLSGRCRNEADFIVRDLLHRALLDHERPECVHDAARDRVDEVVATIADLSLGYEVEETATETANPILGTNGWVVSVALGSSHEGDRAIQYWTLGEFDDGALIVVDVEDLDTDEVVATGRDHVEGYLARLAGGDYPGAAGMLGQGGKDWSERRDLSAFAESPAIQPDLAEALREWCEQGALCTEPVRTSARPTIRGGAVEVVAVWDVGGTEVTATFLGRSYEGAPAVTGLPPIVGRDAVALIAERSGASVVVGDVPGVGIVRWAEGEAAEVPVPDDVWSDGTYFFWVTPGEGDSPNIVSAALADGTVVCEAEGRFSRIRERDDGTFVATVERTLEVLEEVPEDPEWPIPTYAVECATGETTPIEPVSWGFEAGFRTTKTIAGRTFDISYGPEGNGDVLNENGVSVNGDEYAGRHVFAPDAAIVVYGDYTDSHSPHETTTIRARETVDGALLWSAELDRVFGSLDVTDRAAVVSQPPERRLYEPWVATESVWIFDRATGERLHEIPTAVQLLFVG